MLGPPNQHCEASITMAMKRNASLREMPTRKRREIRGRSASPESVASPMDEPTDPIVRPRAALAMPAAVAAPAPKTAGKSAGAKRRALAGGGSMLRPAGAALQPCNGAATPMALVKHERGALGPTTLAAAACPLAAAPQPISTPARGLPSHAMSELAVDVPRAVDGMFAETLPAATVGSPSTGVACSSDRMRERKANAMEFGKHAFDMVRADIDPSSNAGSEFLADVVRCATEVTTPPPASQGANPGRKLDRILRHLSTCSAGVKEAFRQRLTESSYNTPALLEALELAGEEDESTYDLLFQHFYDFFISLIENKSETDPQTDLLNYTKRHPLECTTTKLLSTSLRRVSKCSGLPPCGTVLFAVVQGKAGFYHFGADRDVTFEAVPSTDSTWKLPGHRGSVFIIGPSATGKDTIISIMTAIDDLLKQIAEFARAPCTNVLKVGHPTYAGLIAALQKGMTGRGTSCLVSYNSELKEFPIPISLTDTTAGTETVMRTP